MKKALIRIQKGYILIEKTRDKIRILAENEDVQNEKDKLLEIENTKEKIRDVNNKVKDKIMTKKASIREIDKELNKIIHKLYESQKRDTSSINMYKDKKEDLENEKKNIKDEIMNLFFQVDVLKEEINNCKKEYNDKAKYLRKMITIQNERIVYYEDKISAMEKKIRRIRKSIDSDILALYDKKRQKDIIVMSKVEDGVCFRCKHELDDEIIDMIKENEVAECPNCGRFLYMIEAENSLELSEDDDFDENDIDEDEYLEDDNIDETDDTENNKEDDEEDSILDDEKEIDEYETDDMADEYETDDMADEYETDDMDNEYESYEKTKKSYEDDEDED